MRRAARWPPATIRSAAKRVTPPQAQVHPQVRAEAPVQKVSGLRLARSAVARPPPAVQSLRAAP
jgi:hypothetical protein